MTDLQKTISYDEDAKAEIAHLEGDRGHSIPTPVELQALSSDERAALEKSTTRKIDLLIMPVMVVLYVMNYLDRQNIASAKLADIEVDLGMTLVQYQTCVSLLFAGYIGFQIPSNMIVAKISRPSLYLCAACALWGAVSACTAAVNSYASLAVCRCILGMVEAAFFPGAIYYLSCWYTKRQMGLRTAILYSGSQLGNAFGGLFAAALLTLDGAHGIEGWRWLFLIEGVATVGIAAVCALILPNSIETSRLLNETEKIHLVHSLEIDRGQKDKAGDVNVGRALSMACLDPKTWLSCGLLFFTYVSASVTNFWPSVVATLGFSRTISYCLTAPPYLICVVCIMINGHYSDKRGNRFDHVAYPLLITIIANVIAVSTTNTAARYVAMCLLPASFYSSAICTLSWISGSASGPSVKRAVVLSLINSICNTPNIWTSYLYKNAPRYLMAFAVDLAAAVLAILCAVAFKYYLSRENAKLERGDAVGASGPTQAQIDGGFRYPL